MFFISTIRTNAEGVDDQRPVGCYKNWESAALRVKNNVCDIFEDGYYEYAVIVFIDEGLYPPQQEMQWYEYDRERNLGIEIDRPQLVHIDNQDFVPYIVG